MSAIQDSGAGMERTPQVQKQLEALRLVVERVNKAITEVTAIFRPVLAALAALETYLEAYNG